jgi:nitrate reductase gamma subunit
MPSFLVAPAVAIVLVIVGGILRYRVHVKVTGRQNLGYGPLIAIGANIPPQDKYDQFEWAATNQSLQGAVYVRVFGAVGEGQDGAEIRVVGNYSAEPIRLERNQDH